MYCWFVIGCACLCDAVPASFVDVDLVYVYLQGGQFDGARLLAVEEYFARLGQQLARLLDEVMVEGFSHRVDLRLCLFGTVGRVVLSFVGMD